MKRIVARTTFVPLRRYASDIAEKVNQMLMGETAQVLQTSADGLWHEVRTDFDDYVGWVSALMVVEEAQNWQENIGRIVAHHVLTLLPDGASLLLPLGVCVKRQNDHFILPDGRAATLTHTTVLQVWQPNGQQALLNPIERLFDVALLLKDTPYLWGGRSIFGIDCSGLTQTSALFAGISLPRDARQQALVGEDVSLEIENWRKGDLLFFSNNTEGRITHVALHAQHGRFLHASGYVRWNSLNEIDPDFSARHREQLVRVRRFMKLL